MLGRLLADQARLGRRGALRARGPDERLDLPLGGARRPAARLALAHAHDDGLGRPLPVARRRGRPRDRLARGRIAPSGLVRGADGGAAPPGRLGQDLRPAARAGLGRGGAAALPADVDRGSARCRVPPDRRLHRSEPAHDGPRGGRAARRGGDRDPDPRDRSRRRARAHRGSRDRQGLDRDRGRGQRGRHVRRRDRRSGRRERARGPDGARVPDHEAARRAARRADPARPDAARLLPGRVGRPRHGRVRAPPGAVGAGGDSRRTSTASCSPRTGSGSRS